VLFFLQDKWYSFNDAEVKFFDPNQIASECFGGEMSSRTYDQVTEKFMDLSIEKTNSAYMLFYEKIGGIDEETPGPRFELIKAFCFTIPVLVFSSNCISSNTLLDLD
jgi:hypothetical protein